MMARLFCRVSLTVSDGTEKRGCIISNSGSEVGKNFSVARMAMALYNLLPMLRFYTHIIMDASEERGAFFIIACTCPLLKNSASTCYIIHDNYGL